MSKREENINDILSAWNPLDVDPAISKSEYIEYIPLIEESMGDSGCLRNAIECILKRMDVDTSLDSVRSDTDKVCRILSDF